MSDHERILNVNIGILGHVDSGKTSLVKALSTHLSTAALDKSVQSRQRGMTLDLGFSCFFHDPLPAHLQQAFPTKDRLQITLVDCPGHASLIRTIIGGAQIIDLVLLVVDAYKGWQAQTTECLVLAQLTSPLLVVALNKMDQFAPDERAAKIAEVQAAIRQAHLRHIPRFAEAPMLGVAAAVGGEKVAAASDTSLESSNIPELIDLLVESLPIPQRKGIDAPFLLSIDHCFPIRGRGTVLTGTCLSGSASVGDPLEFPTLQDHHVQARKIKSIQMFQQSVSRIQQGDRAGVCVTNLDAKLLERGWASTPGSVPSLTAAIALVRKVSFYPGRLLSGSKMHVSVGHLTVQATVTFWGAKELRRRIQALSPNETNGRKTMEGKTKELDSAALGGTADMAGLPHYNFDFAEDFEQQSELLDRLGDGDDAETSLLNWALLDFSTPVHCPMGSLVIGSRLDTVVTGGEDSCRLAFSGRLITTVDPQKNQIRWYTPKERRGTIAKLGDPYLRHDDQAMVRYEVIGNDLFKKETNMKIFVGKRVETEDGDVGEIKSSFGTENSFRVHFPAGTTAKEGQALVMRFQRFTHDKEMYQSIPLPAARPGKVVEVEKKKTKLPAGIKRFGHVASLKGDPLENGKFPTAIIAGFFAPEINIKERAGVKVRIASTDEEGSIVGPFGKAGKCKAAFPDGISAEVDAKAELLL